MTTPTHRPVLDEKLQKISQSVIQLMQQQYVDPLPESYAVWYHYVTGSNRDLKKEIDEALAQHVPFTREMLLQLYYRHVVVQKEQQALNESTLGAQNLLAEALRLITEFSGETNAYNKQLDTNVEHLSASTIDNRSLQDIVNEIVERAKSVRDSGSMLQQKLEVSTKEIESLKTNLEKISAESQRDFLTGLYNRKALDTFLDEATKEVKENGGDLCALMIDIDHFKQFNDKFGHLMGDEVLKIVSRSLTQGVKGKDYVARYGGEEFCVLLPQTPLQGGLVVAEALRKFVAGNNLVRKDTGTRIATITVSVGVAKYRPTTDTLEAFLSRADEALYRAKREGRNRVHKEKES